VGRLLDYSGGELPSGKLEAKQTGRMGFRRRGVRLGIMWMVVAGYLAAEFWLPEGMITRSVRFVMGLLLAGIVALLFILIPTTK
jgi:hypothetical protein